MAQQGCAPAGGSCYHGAMHMIVECPAFLSSYASLFTLDTDTMLMFCVLRRIE